MPEETSCRRRNHLSTWEGTRRWTIQVATIMTMLPSANPISGESTMKTAILRIPSATSPSTPSAGSVAPMRPPASACDEEEGRPHHQVRRFQRMAPTSAAKMTVSTIAGPCDLSISNWITPLPMVFATFTPPPKAAMKLKKAAQTTAMPGESTRVDTTVADRKSTRLNSSHGYISYAVFCLKKKKTVVQPPCENVWDRLEI